MCVAIHAVAGPSVSLKDGSASHVVREPSGNSRGPRRWGHQASHATSPSSSPRCPPSCLQPGQPYINIISTTSPQSRHRAIQHHHGEDGRRFGSYCTAAARRKRRRRKKKKLSERCSEAENQREDGNEKPGRLHRRQLSPLILASKPSVFLFFRIAISTGPQAQQRASDYPLVFLPGWLGRPDKTCLGDR